MKGLKIFALIFVVLLCFMVLFLYVVIENPPFFVNLYRNNVNKYLTENYPDEGLHAGEIKVNIVNSDIEASVLNKDNSPVFVLQFNLTFTKIYDPRKGHVTNTGKSQDKAKKNENKELTNYNKTQDSELSDTLKSIDNMGLMISQL